MAAYSNLAGIHQELASEKYWHWTWNPNYDFVFFSGDA